MDESSIVFNFFSVRLYRNTSNPILNCEYECKVTKNGKKKVIIVKLKLLDLTNEIVYSVAPFARPGALVHYFKLEAESANKVWTKLEIAVLRRFKGRAKVADQGEELSATSLVADDLNSIPDEDLKAQEEQMLQKVSNADLGTKMFGLNHPVVLYLLGLDLNVLVTEIELDNDANNEKGE